MRRFSLGQAAMEFFMTYSWAIVIIIAVIGVLFYLGVVDPNNLRVNSCMFNSGFTCFDYRIQSGGNLSLDLGQSVGEDILITGFNCTAASSPVARALGTNVTISSGSHVVMMWNSTRNLNCTKADGTYPVSGEYFQGKLIINYTGVDTQMSHLIKGELNFKVV